MELSKDFFLPEERCGYMVSEKMKKIWAVELDLLEKFVSICEKYDLSYFLDGGSILGAVRHGGFIPWDDDVDVIMPRKDYDKFWEIAKDEIKDPYFFQTTLTEEGFFRTHAQIRNSNTTGFVNFDANKPQINKGIFLDIFPLDVVPKGKIKKTIFKYEILFHKMALTYKNDRVFSELRPLSKMFFVYTRVLFFFVPDKKYFDFFNHKILAKYKDKDTGIVGDISLAWRENCQWDASWWRDYCIMDFENLKLRVPIDYDKILTRQYGDYMKFPEDVTALNFGTHGNITFDPDTPYKMFNG